MLQLLLLLLCHLRVGVSHELAQTNEKTTTTTKRIKAKTLAAVCVSELAERAARG